MIVGGGVNGLSLAFHLAEYHGIRDVDLAIKLGEALGVEEDAVHAFDRAFRVGVVDGVVAAFVVGGVADDGVIDRGEVDADLVRPAGLEPDVDQARGGERLDHLVVRDRRPAAADDGEAPVVLRVPVDRGVDGAAVLCAARIRSR